MKINDVFTDSKGNIYPNVREIAFFDYEKPFKFGKSVAETKHEETDFFPYDPEEGVYIFQTLYDEKKGLRVDKDWVTAAYKNGKDEYGYAVMIQKLQGLQSNIKLTTFPMGVLTYDGKVIGQEIPLFDGYISFFDVNESFTLETKKDLLIKAVNILIELENNKIYYKDIHRKNFLFCPTSLTIQLIDFDPLTYLKFDEDGKYAYRDMIQNFYVMLKLIMPSIHVEVENVSKMEQFLCYLV